MNEKEIIELGKSYGVSVSIVGNCAYLHTLGDSDWYFNLDGIKTKQIVLYHKNSKGSKKYHRQRLYYDLDFLFKSIRDHENFVYTPYRKPSRMDKIFQQIKQENEQKKNLKKGKKSNKDKYVS